MKSVIFNYYNIIVDDILFDDDKYYFSIGNDSYIVSKVYNLDMFLSVLKYSNYNIFYNVILNNDNKYYFNFQNNIYCLLKIDGISSYNYKLDELKHYVVNEKFIDWGKVWSDRLDYYEVQIRELGKNNQEILDSFSFYKGLAENAILYYNIIVSRYSNPTVGIVHNRIRCPNKEIDYLNPVNYLFDYIVRDISEYIKFNFFYSDIVDDYIMYLDNINLNKMDFNLLYCRLLYPTYYFDIYDDVILNNSDNNNLYVIFNKTKDYIYLLKKIYIRYKDKYDLLNVEWLNKIKM